MWIVLVAISSLTLYKPQAPQCGVRKEIQYKQSRTLISVSTVHIVTRLSESRIGVARQLSYLLPESYGSDVEVRHYLAVLPSPLKLWTEQALIREHNHAYPHVRTYVSTISGAIVYFALWPKGFPWRHALLIQQIIATFIEYGYLSYLNYAQVLLDLLAASRYSNTKVAISKNPERLCDKIHGRIRTCIRASWRLRNGFDGIEPVV